MSEESFIFGTTAGGEAVRAFKIINAAGASSVLIEYGAVLQSLFVPNAAGGFTDVALGFETLAEYEADTESVGATVGRFANRIGGAAFSLNGKEYKLYANEGGNTLHGGKAGFTKRLWQGEQLSPSSVRFSRLSPDGEENFPGNMTASVTYTLTDDNALHLYYEAETDADTMMNLTNHSYFDLSGCGNALENELWVNAEKYLELDAGGIPTGRYIPVEGTAFDFRTAKKVGKDIHADDPQIITGKGYDRNYCLSGTHAAALSSADTGIRMDVYTDQPGVQLYTSNNLPTKPGKYGSTMGLYCAVCLETQIYPDGMHHYGFPSAILRAGEKFTSETVYSFSIM